MGKFVVKLGTRVLCLITYFVDMDIRGKFTEHPHSVDESYFEHMRVAASFSRQLAQAAFCCGVHAVFPWMHCSTGSSKVKELHAQMTAGARSDVRDEQVEAFVA